MCTLVSSDERYRRSWTSRATVLSWGAYNPRRAAMVDLPVRTHRRRMSFGGLGNRARRYSERACGSRGVCECEIMQDKFAVTFQGG